MARENYYEFAIRKKSDGTVEVLQNLRVSVYNAGTSTLATVYAGRTGGTLATNPALTDSTGFINFWMDPGDYDIKWEDTQIPVRISNKIVGFSSAPGGTGVITGTQLVDKSVTSSQIANNAITTNKIINGSVTDSKISRDATVGSLPGSPSNGQEAYYLAKNDAKEAVIWHMKYNSGSALTSKWEFIGGQYIYALQSNTATHTTANLTTTATMTNTPSLTVPLAGTYEIEFGGLINNPGASAVIGKVQLNGSSVGLFGNAIVFSSQYFSGGTGYFSQMSNYKVWQALSASEVLTLKVATNNTSVSFGVSPYVFFIAIRPVRLT